MIEANLNVNEAASTLVTLVYSSLAWQKNSETNLAEYARKKGQNN